MSRMRIRRTVMLTTSLVGTALLALAGCQAEGDQDSSVPHLGKGAVASDLRRVGDPEAVLPANTLRSLKGIKPLEPKALGNYVRDRQAAVVLGKALFWDTQAGSDGQACASCHYHAGADARRKNQLNPGFNNTAGAPKSQTFDKVGSGSAGGPNYTLTAKDFPFHQLSDPNDPNSKVVFDTDDVASSQGTVKRAFVSTNKSEDGRDACTPQTDIFVVGKTTIRRVPPRNTPSVLNAVFFDRLFWDGRANNTFNGVTPFGARDPNATIVELQPNGTTAEVELRLENAALASQAVGPILSAVEMSCDGRTLVDVGHKLLSKKPLALQNVAADDSVLGTIRARTGKGLATTYEKLVKQAFDPKYWSAPTAKGQKPQIERNFSMFWGLAIMLYESTLISDDAPIDRYMDGDKTALTPLQIYGKSLFEGQAGCINCHHGPAASGAAFAYALPPQPTTGQETEANETNTVERMVMNDGRVALYDNGFYNIGVRPTSEDLGIGGNDPWGNPLSLARQAKRAAAGIPPTEPLRFETSRFVFSRGLAPGKAEREATDGSFKTPSLRNVELTGPYFHNGGQATLEQVVDFYSRGGDRRGGTLQTSESEQFVTGPDSTGYGDNETNMDADVHRLFLSPQGKAALVAFLKAFTDERVRWERAPFDHPSISLPNGIVPDRH